MKRKPNLTEVLKIRCTKSEKEVIVRAAKQANMNLSAFSRAVLIGREHTDSLTLKIHNELIRNEFLNRINGSLSIQPKIKEIIIKELTDVEEYSIISHGKKI